MNWRSRISFPSSRHRTGLLALLLFFTLTAGPSRPTVAQDTQRPTSKPYSGDLSIFEYPDRDKKLQIDRVMDILAITPGRTVVDIGAGSGWFTVRAAPRVGDKGAVIAEDINPK